MPYSHAILNLRKEIEQDKRSIEEIKSFLTEKEDLLRRLYVLQERSKKATPGVIDSPPLRRYVEIEEAHVGRTLMTAVREAIDSVGNQEFQVPVIQQILPTIGFELGGKYPRSRISTTLEKLAQAGEIIRTVEGKGSAPHRYKAAKYVTQEGGDPA